MFTGIIEELGRIESLEPFGGGIKIRVAANVVTEGTVDGDSISVNGVCLTALGVKPNSFEADISQETLERSTLGRLAVGTPVNLERAVTPQTRLGGDIVQGHVDTRGTFVGAEQLGGFWTVTIQFPPEVSKYLIFKGSIAVEGISLTIAELHDDRFDIAVIPKTWQLTNLSSLKPGDPVNLEVDMVAKYIERMLPANFSTI